MAEPRTVLRQMSAGVILVDREGRVLMQLRDDDPKIMFPGHWGLTGGAAQPGETPEQTARREVLEETGLNLDRFEPFRAYYFSDERPANGKRRPANGNKEYELYLYHAPCTTPAADLACGEGRALRFFAPDEIDALDIAYNHRDVLAEFFVSPAYARYVSGAAFEPSAIDPVAHLRAEIARGEPWFEALLDAIALWEQPEEVVDGRRYRYLVGGEAFDWLLLAERLMEAAGGAPEDEVQRLLFDAIAPGIEGATVNDTRLRERIGETKHRAHLNFIYGVTVEEALQYATELEVAKERASVSISDRWDGPPARDPVYERIYGGTRAALWEQARDELGLSRGEAISLAELREFQYWLFKYRVKHSEPARVASDTRKALAQLSAIEAATQRRRRRTRSEAHP